jgi:hypothetical protein
VPLSKADLNLVGVVLGPEQPSHGQNRVSRHSRYVVVETPCAGFWYPRQALGVLLSFLGGSGQIPPLGCDRQRLVRHVRSQSECPRSRAGGSTLRRR